jgi:hypothetical protein
MEQLKETNKTTAEEARRALASAAITTVSPLAGAGLIGISFKALEIAGDMHGDNQEIIASVEEQSGIDIPGGASPLTEAGALGVTGLASMVLGAVLVAQPFVKATRFARTKKQNIKIRSENRKTKKEEKAEIERA